MHDIETRGIDDLVIMMSERNRFYDDEHRLTQNPWSIIINPTMNAMLYII